MDQAEELIQFFRDFMLSAPDELTAYIGFLFGPDGSRQVGVIPCYCGDIEEGKNVVQPLRDWGSPLLDTVAEIPFPVMQSMLDASYPKGRHHYWKYPMMRDLPDDAIRTIVGQAKTMLPPYSSIVIGCYGGAMRRVAANETAFPHRQEMWDVGFFAQWTDEDDGKPHVAWARKAYDAMQPFASNGSVLSFLGADEDEAIRRAFGENYGRLRAVKKRYDPENFFQVNHNIEPAA
jgi:hypothetical protein